MGVVGLSPVLFSATLAHLMSAANEHREALQANGYTIVRDALTPLEIGTLRRAIAQFIERGEDIRHLYSGIFKTQVFVPSPDDVFLPLIAHERITQTLRDIFGGPFMFATEMGIAANNVAGWHKDTHSLSPFDRKAHADFGVYKVLIYPQDELANDESDFALKVRPGSHWISNFDEGKEVSVFVRAGDAIIMDVRLTHRGHKDPMEGRSLAARALYSPLRRYAPGVVYSAKSHVRRALGRRDRYLATLLFGKCNSHTEGYMRAGREVTKARWPQTTTTAVIPSHWAERLTNAGIRY